MKITLRNTATAALALATAIPSALAEAPVSPASAGGAGNFQGPGWASYCPGAWMMSGWRGPLTGYGGYGGGGWIMMIFGTVIIVAMLVFIFRTSARTSHPPRQPMLHNRTYSAGLHALDERYARGEISRDEYLQKKRDILEG